jgi:hypothetical protein
MRGRQTLLEAEQRKEAPMAADGADCIIPFVPLAQRGKTLAFARFVCCFVWA